MTKRFRFVIVLALIGISAYFIYPTVRWYFFIPEETRELAAGSREQIREYASDRADEALDDLTELANEDPDQPLPEDYAFLSSEARDIYRVQDLDVPDQWAVGNTLAVFGEADEVHEELEAFYAQEMLDYKEIQNRIITLGLDLSGGTRVVVEANRASLREALGEDQELTEDQVDEAIDLAVTILLSRIDEFGVTEPVVRRREGTDQIIIEVPGDTDRSSIESFLQGRGSLAFLLVHNEATGQLIRLQQDNPTWDPETDGVPDFIPAGTRIAPYVVPDQYGSLELLRYIVIYEDVDEFGLPGQYIESAQIGTTQLANRPTVNFQLDNEGREIFATLTRENEGESLAIVLDGRVRTQAVINDPITGGNVQISGFDREEAENIRTVLQTAALPVELVIESQQTVGSSLGAEAVQAGLFAIALGFGLVVVFMLFYYLGAGIIADLALVLNLFFILSTLSVFNLTLTLTSIAGIILTVGMAVDANVIIFERIKEEYRLGKSRQASVTAGFQKAFWTIMDANITTFIAALFLSQLGTGPVQGFAVTLAVGIFWSMFTALFLSRLIFDFGTDVLKRSKLSLGWGVR